MSCPTFIQPVAEPIENNTFLSCGDHSDGLFPHMGTVIDVILKDKYLIWREKEKENSIKQWLHYKMLHFAFTIIASTKSHITFL